MKEIWMMIQAIFTAIGGRLRFYFGGLDGLILALVIFVVADYITGVMCAIADRCLSSSVGFKGIFKKVVIFMFVGLAHALDSIFIGSGNMIRTAVIFFMFQMKELVCWRIQQD